MPRHPKQLELPFPEDIVKFLKPLLYMAEVLARRGDVVIAYPETVNPYNALGNLSEALGLERNPFAVEEMIRRLSLRLR